MKKLFILGAALLILGLSAIVMGQAIAPSGGGGGTPGAGSGTQVAYWADGGYIKGDSNLIWDPVNKTLFAKGASSSGAYVLQLLDISDVNNGTITTGLGSNTMTFQSNIANAAGRTAYDFSPINGVVAADLAWFRDNAVVAFKISSDGGVTLGGPVDMVEGQNVDFNGSTGTNYCAGVASNHAQKCVVPATSGTGFIFQDTGQAAGGRLVDFMNSGGLVTYINADGEIVSNAGFQSGSGTIGIDISEGVPVSFNGTSRTNYCNGVASNHGQKCSVPATSGPGYIFNSAVSSGDAFEIQVNNSNIVQFDTGGTASLGGKLRVNENNPVTVNGAGDTTYVKGDGTNHGMVLGSNVTNASTNIAYLFNTANTLSGTTSLAKWQNNGQNAAAIGPLGDLYAVDGGYPVPAVHSTNWAGPINIEFGADAGTAGVLDITFGTAFSANAVCLCNDVDATAPIVCGPKAGATTTGVRFLATAAGSDVINWHCFGPR